MIEDYELCPCACMDLYIHTHTHARTRTQMVAAAAEAKDVIAATHNLICDGKAIFNHAEQYTVRFSRALSVDRLTCRLYVISLDYLAARDSDRLTGKYCLNTPFLCSSALHSHSLSCRRFNLPVV